MTIERIIFAIMLEYILNMFKYTIIAYMLPITLEIISLSCKCFALLFTITNVAKSMM